MSVSEKSKRTVRRAAYEKSYNVDRRMRLRAARVAGLSCNPSEELVEALAMKIGCGDCSLADVEAALSENIGRFKKIGEIQK
jgi:hypothetical protein